MGEMYLQRLISAMGEIKFEGRFQYWILLFFKNEFQIVAELNLSSAQMADTFIAIHFTHSLSSKIHQLVTASAGSRNVKYVDAIIKGS